MSASADYGVSITESFTPPEEWVPGQSVNKDTYAVNTGNVDALVMQSVSSKLSMTYETTTKNDPNNPAGNDEAGKAVSKSKYVTLGTKYSETAQPDGTTVVTSDEVTAIQAGSTVAYAPLQVAKKVNYTYDDNSHIVKTAYATYDGDVDPSKCIYPIGDSAIGDSTTPKFYQNIVGAIITAVDGTYTKQATNGSLTLTAGDPNKSDRLGVSFDGASFQPNTTGLYIFRRYIDKKDSTTADTTQDYEYEGYYYIQNDTTDWEPGKGTYYKVDKDALNNAMRSGDFSSYMNDEGLLLTYKIENNDTTAATPGNDTANSATTKLVKKGESAGSGTGDQVTSSNYYTDDYIKYVYINSNDEVVDSSKETTVKTGHTQVTTDLESAVTKYKYDTNWVADNIKNGAIYVIEEDKVVTPQLTWKDNADGNATDRSTLPMTLVATYDNDTTVENYENNYTATVTDGDTLATTDIGPAATAISETWTDTPATDAQKITNQKIIVAAREAKYDAAERAYVAAKEAYEAAKAAGTPSDTSTLKTAMTTALTKMNADKAAWAKSKGILDAMEKATQDDTVVNIKLTENAINNAATAADKWQMVTVPMAATGTPSGQNQVVGYDSTDYRFDKDTAYFYYTSVLESGETSSQLIDSVELDSSVTQYAFKDIDFDLNIGLNSVQHLRAENGDEVIPTVDTKTALQAGTTGFSELKLNNSTATLYPKATYDGTNVTEINYIDWSTSAHT